MLDSDFKICLISLLGSGVFIYFTAFQIVKSTASFGPVFDRITAEFGEFYEFYPETETAKYIWPMSKAYLESSQK